MGYPSGGITSAKVYQTIVGVGSGGGCCGGDGGGTFGIVHIQKFGIEYLSRGQTSAISGSHVKYF